MASLKCSDIGMQCGFEVKDDDLDDLVEAVRRGNRAIASFDCSVFTGEYVSGGGTVDYLERLERSRSDSAKEQRRPSERAVIDLYNSA